ncbi:MAG: flagellar export chaperone FliS, partial [Planctomycetes bacterium]|nr:flagellar export chaperone FliS [Planctomycetota bacterium]
MALPNARQQYLRTQIETASKEQLVVMLFDGILRFTEIARKAIEAKQIEDSHHALMRAQAIVMELICTVDKEKGGEIASNLMALHAYAFNCLITANMRKDVTKLDEVQNIYRKLREGWVGAMENLGIAAASSNPTGGQPAPKAPTPPTRTPGPAPIPKAPPSAGMRSLPTGAPAAPKPTTGPGGIIAAAKPVVLGQA